MSRKANIMIKVIENSMGAEMDHFINPLAEMTGAVPGPAPASEQPHHNSVPSHCPNLNTAPGYGLAPGQIFDGSGIFYHIV